MKCFECTVYIVNGECDERDFEDTRYLILGYLLVPVWSVPFSVIIIVDAVDNTFCCSNCCIVTSNLIFCILTFHFSYFLMLSDLINNCDAIAI